MRILRSVIVLGVIISIGVLSWSMEIKKWEGVLNSRKPVKIYVEEIVNKTDDPNVSADLATKVIKDVFSTRISPEFKVVEDKSKAQIIFKGAMTEYTWQKVAPITNVYSPGALAFDALTRYKKNWARLQINYSIVDAKNGRVLLKDETQVTIKQANVPKNKSYSMIFGRLPKIFSMDIFKRFKRDN